MNPRGIRTLLILIAIGLLLWAVIITSVIVVFLVTEQPVALPAP